MAGNLERALAVLELLARHGGPMPLANIADTLDIPRSGTHRLLSMLIDEGFVRQDEEHGEYMLAMKLVSLALIYLSTSGVFDLSQPVLDRLAEASGELARLGVVEDDHITFVGKAQGANRACATTPTWAATRRCTAPRAARRGSQRCRTSVRSNLCRSRAGLGRRRRTRCARQRRSSNFSRI